MQVNLNFFPFGDGFGLDKLVCSGDVFRDAEFGIGVQGVFEVFK